MSRVIVILLAAAAAIVGVVLLTSGGDDSAASKHEYRVELDNASGLTDGADLRAAGVKIGSIKKLEIDPKTARAIAVVTVSKPAFGGLRADTKCEIKPQSLIGEYFMDCDPGVSRKKLDYGDTVPISNTSGTIPPDLVMNTLRLPYRQKLGLILTELGGGFAARGGDVNTTIQRAIPALRETDKVLNILSTERQTLRQLTRDSDTVVGALDKNRLNVSRFVSEARDTAQISTRRRHELAGTIQRLPTFERTLRPTLRDLGVAAKRQTPALRDLRIAAPSLTTLLNRLGPFADASVPAVRALGRASVTGTQAVKDAAPTVRRLRRTAAAAKEPLTNLRYILEHLDNRAYAVEKNPLSPGGAGFTGLEAVTQYFFTQSQAINLFDSRGYVLKLGLLANECSGYTNGTNALANPERTKRCSAALGPGGKIEATPTTASQTAARTSATPSSTSTTTTPSTPGATAPSTSSTPTTSTPSGSSTTAKPGVVPPITLPGVGTVTVPGVTTPAPTDPGTSDDLLNYLLG